MRKYGEKQTFMRTVKVKQTFGSNQNRILGGGGSCSSKANLLIENPSKTQELKKQQIQQIMKEKQQLKDKFPVHNQDEQEEEQDDGNFNKFIKQYDKYFTTRRVKEKEIETDVSKIIEKSLFDYREQIIQPEIRDRVIDMINLLINYLLIIKQSNSKQSIQSDIKLLTDKLLTLVYLLQRKQRKISLLRSLSVF